MPRPSLFNLAVSRINRLPRPLRRPLLGTLLRYSLRLSGAGGLRFERLDELRAVLHLRNHRRQRNAAGEVHAATLAMLAESASGALFRLNLPAGKQPLLRGIRFDNLGNARGDLRAQASIDDVQRRLMQREDHGEIIVTVQLTSAAGDQPVSCRMVWSWRLAQA